MNPTPLSAPTSAVRFQPWRLLHFKLLRELSKSGIVTLVMISVTAGYLVGQPFERAFDFLHLLRSFAGILLLAAGSSALNQIQEVEIDRRMPRTADRPLPSGRITIPEALFFCVVTIAAGVAILATIQVSLALFGLAAVASYNGLYTLWWKKTMAFGAVPGAIPGALPILMGYIAADGNWKSPGGWYLFFLLFFWQMPHFWSLAIRYADDYESGGIPTLPVAKGVPVTVYQIALWCFAYVALSFAAPLFLRVGSVYLGTTIITGAVVLWQLKNFLRHEAKTTWLRFFLWVNFSLIFYLGALVIDQWSIHLIPFLKSRS